jgi:hypothetical protein
MEARLPRSRVRLVCAALLLPFALSCASSQEKPGPAAKLRAEIRDVVADPGRASEMLAAVDEMEAISAELDALIAAERRSLVALVREYATAREEIEKSLAEFNARHESIARRFLEVHASLKAQASAAEWQKLRKPEMEMLASASGKTIGQAKPAGKES